MVGGEQGDVARRKQCLTSDRQHWTNKQRDKQTNTPSQVLTVLPATLALVRVFVSMPDPDPDPASDIINALDRLFLQSGVQGGKFPSPPSVPRFLSLSVESVLHQFETRVRSRFPTEGIRFTR